MMNGKMIIRLLLIPFETMVILANLEVLSMGKSKQYLEWRDNTRRQKLKVVKGIIQMALFIFDLCI